MAGRRTLRRTLSEALDALAESRGLAENARRLHQAAAPRRNASVNDLAELDQAYATLDRDRRELDAEVGRLVLGHQAQAEAIGREITASTKRQRAHLDSLGHAAPGAAPGWLGRLWPPDGGPPTLIPVKETPAGALVRVGTMQPFGDQTPVPLLLPLLGHGHLQIDVAGDAAQEGADDSAVALLRALVMRVIAAARPGDVRLFSADPAHVGGALADFQPLVAAGVAEPTATSATAFRAMLGTAEQHVRDIQAEVTAVNRSSLTELRARDGRTDLPYALMVFTSIGAKPSADDNERLASLARIGPAMGLHIIGISVPGDLEHAQRLIVGAGRLELPVLGPGTGARPDTDPGSVTVGTLCRQIADQAEQERRSRTPTLESIVLPPAKRWTESSVDEVRTVIGRTGVRPFTVAFNDATPHWFLGGRSGSGKTVFLLDLLYGLTTRYSPDELSLYLLDFKEGVSFSEFAPGESDPSWLPHARAVGIESDREYGLAVLRQLSQEMVRRSNLMKRYGVSKLADLRANSQDTAVPRIVAIIDEFQVLLQGNDRITKESVALLEELARKGRSYGIHMTLASQSISSIEALWTKAKSIFAQFPLRVALPGASEVLDPIKNGDAAARLSLGQVIINEQAGIAGANVVVTFPNAVADPEVLNQVRMSLWESRPPGSLAPAVFRGFERQRLDNDASFRRAKPAGRTPVAMVGKTLDVDLGTAKISLDSTPGRHLGVVGSSLDGAGILHAAAVSIAAQHEPGSAAFLVGSYAEAASDAADDAIRRIKEFGHDVEIVSVQRIRSVIGHFADHAHEREGFEWPDDLPMPRDSAYLVLFGVDSVSGRLMENDRARSARGADDMQAFLRLGPAKGLHLLGWWRQLRRAIDDVGGSSGRENLATIVATNVSGDDLRTLVGRSVEWNHRENRAIFLDQHENTTQVIMPFAFGESE